MNTNNKLKKSLRNGASGLAIGLILPVLALGSAGASFAQTPAAGADETVIVTGQRKQIATAQKIKKDSDVIVDSVTAVDIGALPDRSVAEALQRISGLTIQRASEARDPIRMTAEGSGVAIRGLSWVRSETNGRDIFSAKNGRGLSWEDVSADLLAGVDVYKNPSADMIEGGIGGTVNLRTRLPFDSKKRVLAFSLDAMRGDLQEKNNLSGGFVYSDRADTKIGEIGWLLNYSESTVGNETHVIGVDRYNAGKLTTTAGVSSFNSDLTTPGTTVYIPNTMGWRTIDWNQKRTALALALQWRPNDAWEITLQAMNAQADPKNTEYNTGFYNDTGEFTSSASLASYSYGSTGLFQKGTVVGASLTSNTRYGQDEKDTTDVSLGFRFNASDKFTLTGDLQYVRSLATVLSNTAFIQLENRPNVTIDITGELPTIQVQTPNSAGDASKYYWAAAMDHLEKNNGDQVSARIDGKYDFDDAGWLKSFKFGMRQTDKNYETRQTGYNWGLLSYQYWGSGGGAAVYLPNSTQGPGLAGAEQVPFSNFMGGDVPVPGAIWFPNASVVNQGTAKTYELLKNTETSGWGWTPLSTDWSQQAASGGLNTQGEKTFSTYGLLKFEGDANMFGAGRAIDGNIGVRIVKTEVTGSSFISVTAPNTPLGFTCTANCSVYNSAVTFGNGTIPYAGSNEYTNALPSFNIRYKYDNKLQFRFAASKGIVRPELSWVTPYSSLGSSFQTTSTGATSFAVVSSTLTGTGGNPNLKPIEADQFDITGEWYFAPTGSLTMAIFHKDLGNYIFTESGVETYTNNGVSLDFTVQRYVNGTETGKLDGFEIAYNQFYDFLPGLWAGFGLQANYTKLESSGGRNSVSNVFDGNQVTGANLNGLPLEGMSPESYNIAGLYEKYGISARLAYNWRSSYLYTTSAANVNRPMWSDAYGQLDGSIFYSITPNYKIGIQGTNLGRTTAFTRVSSDLTKPLDTQFYSATKTDRRIAIVLRGSF